MVIFALLHGICILACWCIWGMHIIILLTFDTHREIIQTSLSRKMFAAIIWLLGFTVPEITLYLSYKFLSTDISDLRKHYENQKESRERRRLGN